MKLILYDAKMCEDLLHNDDFLAHLLLAMRQNQK